MPASITLDRRLHDATFSIEFLAWQEHVLMVGTACAGKSLLAEALGYAAVQSGHAARFSPADDHFWVMK